MERELKGVLISIDALLSAILLFGILIISFKLSVLSQGSNEQTLILRDYAKDTLLISQKMGAIDNILKSQDDSVLVSLISTLPPAVCMQIEIYNQNITPTKLNYSYVMGNCTKDIKTASSSYTRFHIYYVNSSYYSYVWTRAIAFARG